MAIWIFLILSIVVASFFWINQPRRIIVDAPLPSEFPEQGFAHDSFEALLREYVTAEGQVDYKRWHASDTSVGQLDAYLAAVSRYSPDNASHRFPERNDELAYWMYGYNAYVIKAVLDHWPLASVTDVKAPIEAVKGLGFFYRLRFSFGGEYLSLLTVENNRIRSRYRDARIHFVLNCASESCPVARPELPTGKALDQLMQRAAHEFVNDPDNVFVDHEIRTVFLSTIFKWYKKDFLNDLRAKGRPADRGLIDYVATIATGTIKNDLDAADGYTVEFRDYDWRLND
jgi:hypothetical protein